MGLNSAQSVSVAHHDLLCLNYHDLLCRIYGGGSLGATAVNQHHANVGLQPHCKAVIASNHGGSSAADKNSKLTVECVSDAADHST
jgi:hypothetical protein